MKNTIIPCITLLIFTSCAQKSFNLPEKNQTTEQKKVDPGLEISEGFEPFNAYDRKAFRDVDLIRNVQAKTGAYFYNSVEISLQVSLDSTQKTGSTDKDGTIIMKTSYIINIPENTRGRIVGIDTVHNILQVQFEEKAKVKLEFGVSNDQLQNYVLYSHKGKDYLYYNGQKIPERYVESGGYRYYFLKGSNSMLLVKKKKNKESIYTATGAD